MLHCPNCYSREVKKNGKTHYGKQNHKCKECGRQFVNNSNHIICGERLASAQRLLYERTSLRAGARVCRVSLTWFCAFATRMWAGTPFDMGVNWQAIEQQLYRGSQLLVVQADEMWSFVGKKEQKAWIWVIYEPLTKQVIGFHVGDRSTASAKRLQQSVPQHLRRHLVWCTDYWTPYKKVVPPERHVQSKKWTHQVEGLFSAVRAHVSRLVRKASSFSKDWDKHVAAIKYFFWQFNLRHQPYI